MFTPACSTARHWSGSTLGSSTTHLVESVPYSGNRCPVFSSKVTSIVSLVFLIFLVGEKGDKKRQTSNRETNENTSNPARLTRRSFPPFNKASSRLPSGLKSRLFSFVTCYLFRHHIPSSLPCQCALRLHRYNPPSLFANRLQPQSRPRPPLTHSTPSIFLHAASTVPISYTASSVHIPVPANFTPTSIISKYPLYQYTHTRDFTFSFSRPFLGGSDFTASLAAMSSEPRGEL